MQKHDKFNIKYITRAQRWYKNYLAALGSFLIAFAAASTFAPVHNSSAEDAALSNNVTVTNTASSYYVTVSSTDVALDVESIPTGQLASAKNTVNVKTNAPSGYKLYISASSSDMYNSADTSKEYAHISGVNGTLADQKALGQNTWGFTLDEVATPVPAASATFAKVPDDNTELISEAAAANLPDGTDTDVYYGVNANTSLAAGTYSTTVYYTATAEGVSEPFMQDFTNADCQALSANSTTRLMDSRNAAIYTIVKAKDGNCWMADNLAISDVTISSADSNLNSGTFTIPESSNWDSTATATDAYVHVTENEGYEGEHYYTWAAATAGATPINDTANVTTSICPKGWRLPINGDSTVDKSWASLMNAYSITAGSQLVDAAEGSEEYNLGIRKYYGYWDFGANSEQKQGTDGRFWSSTASSSYGAYDLVYYSHGASTSDATNRIHGFTVRCVFGDSRTMADITYMQDINTNICQNTAEGYSKTLLDKRGNYSAGTQNSGYGVLKAKDGNCWMTANFNLYNKEITSEDSDLANGATYTIPDSTPYADVITARTHRATTTGYTDQVYYNWSAAVAVAESSGITTQYNTSICPKNWQLPVNGDKNADKSFGKLFDAYGVTKSSGLMDVDGSGYALGFHGLYGKDGEWEQGVNGLFWTSTATNASTAYNLHYGREDFRPYGNPAWKSDGWSVRCLAR